MFQVDLVSPLMTQLTYEGLIDEFFGIGQTKVRLPEDAAAKTSPSSNGGGGPSSPPVHILNSADELFADLRDRHFQLVAPILQKRVKAIAAQEQQLKKVERVAELKVMVKHDLPQHNVSTRIEKLNHHHLI